MGSLLWSSDRPEFTERIAKLAGSTTYRVPVEGRGTKFDQLPDAHAIATALAFARRGPQDIGPDVAYCLVLQSDAYRNTVCLKLAEAVGDAADGREIKGARQYAMAACQAAWDAVIHLEAGVNKRKPPNCKESAWDVLLLTALCQLHDSAWASLFEAERRYRSAA